MINAPASFNDEELIQNIYRQNEQIKEAGPLEQFQVETKVISSFRGKRTPEDRCNIIVSVSARYRRLMLTHGTIALGWTTIRVDDHLPLLRCFK